MLSEANTLRTLIMDNCRATTQAGSSCSRAARRGCDGFCRQHYEQEVTRKVEETRDRDGQESKQNNDPFGDLPLLKERHHKKVRWTCSGSGHIVGSEGVRIPCSFIVVQYTEGSIFLACEIEATNWSSFLEIEPRIRAVGSQADFQGLSADGYDLCLRDMGYRGRTSQSPLWTAFEGGTAVLRALPESAPHSVRFHIVNLNLAVPGPTAVTLSNGLAVTGRQLPLLIDDIDLSVRMHDGAPEIVETLKSTRGVAVTGEIIAPLSDLDELPAFERRAHALCSILTFLYQTQVNWIAYHVVSEAGTIIRTVIAHMFTSGFGNPHYLSFTANLYVGHHGSFIQQAYSRFYEAVNDWDIFGVIGVYIESRNLDGFYVEARGLMLATCMEIACYRYLNLEQKAFILSEEQYELVCKELKSALKQIVGSHCSAAADDEIQQSTEGTSLRIGPRFTLREVRGLMYGNIPGLNRYPFALTLKEACAKSGFDADSEAVKRFKNNRNHLVHRGYFYVPDTNQDRYNPRPEEFWPGITEVSDDPALVAWRKQQGRRAQGAVDELRFMDQFIGNFILSVLGCPRSLNG